MTSRSIRFGMAMTVAAAMALPSSAQATGASAPARQCLDNLKNTLQIIHSSDNESSFQNPNTLEEKILGYSAVVRGLRLLGGSQCTPALHLTAGDHTIPGPFYQASAEVPGLGAPGLADIAMYNFNRVRANGMGNHEFDGGIDEFATMLATAEYPFLAANLDFSNVVLADGTPPVRAGLDAGPCALARGKVVKSCWVQAGLDRVGLIGRAPADFFNVIEDPPTRIPGLDFVGGRDADNQPLVSGVDQVLEQADALRRRGVRRIVLLDHAQDFTGDPILAENLRDIDLIVTAGSTGFMANAAPSGPFSLLRAGDAPELDYPQVRTDRDGHTVLVVNSDQLYRYVGNLIVRFDRAGRIVGFDSDSSGPVSTDAVGQVALGQRVGPHAVRPDRQVETLFRAIQQTPSIQDAFTRVGSTNFPLNGTRASVRTRETNLGRLAADSTLVFTRQQFPALAVDVTLKNGGGIRDDITGPEIIRLTIQAALAFDNKLSIVELTADQLLAAMENAVSRVPAVDGRFPQIAGMQLEFDATQPPLEAQASVATPSRVVTLRITRADGTVDTLVENGVVQGSLARTFVMATNSFLLTGGDGYVAFAAGTPLAETEIGEQRILEQHIQDILGGVVDLADPPADPRVVRLD